MAPVKPNRCQCGSTRRTLYSSFRTDQNRIESFTARSITSGLAARREFEDRALMTRTPRGRLAR